MTVLRGELARQAFAVFRQCCASTAPAQAACSPAQLSSAAFRSSGASLGPGSLWSQLRGLHTPSGAHSINGLPSSPHALRLLRSRQAQLLQLRQFADQAPRARVEKPPVTLQGLLISLMVGAAGITAVKSYRDAKVQTATAQSQQVAGKAAVGGPFELIDFNGKPFSDKDLRGEFAVLYFGFTFCPDICPDELEKVARAIDLVEKKIGVQVQPVFISVDPERDTPEKIKSYVREFHPRMIGLTGSLDDIKRTSKAYRVYFNKTADNSKDYLVDHSIIHYLIDPEGEFVTFYAKSYTPEQIADSMCEHVVNWKQSHPSYHEGKQIKLPAKSSS